MIWNDLGVGVLALVCVFSAGFCAGAAYAAYRAMGWERRMYAWAEKVCNPKEPS